MEKYHGYEGYYNFYNIGATSSSEPMGAIINGLKYAKDGNGASSQTKAKYLIPWNNKEKAITGGAIFIGSSYILVGQDTIYLQKFHVVSQNSGELFWHQYMTNVLAPYSEAKIIYQGYKNNGMLQNDMTFIIPVYNNMPENFTENPNILESDFFADNTKVYANVTDGLNIRTGPSTSYESITVVNSNQIMTRIAKGNQKGELWDKVKLSNGIIGYAFHQYLKEVPEKQIEKIELSLDGGGNQIQKGVTKKLQVHIFPEEAKNHAVTYTSSNSSILHVDSSGNLLGLQAGKATITVKAKENSVSSKIEIEVVVPVTGVQIDIEEYMLEVGKSYKLNAKAIPEDATNKNLIYSCANTEILKVEQNGNITGLKTGNSKVIIQTQEGNFKVEVNVIVVDAIEGDSIIFKSPLKVVDHRVSGLDYENLTVKRLKEQIETTFLVEVYNFNGQLLNDNDIVGTGSKIKIIDEKGNIKMQYEIILYGDLSGDGKISSYDGLLLQRHVLGIEPLKPVFLVAGNINKNGKTPSSFDGLLIQRHVLGLQIISQL